MHTMPRFFCAVICSGLISLMYSCSGPVKDGQPAGVHYLEGDSAIRVMTMGMQVADSVGALLRSELMLAMGEGGPVHAVEFCNANALPLTASLSGHFGAEVKRTSDRLRNPANAPSDLEALVLADYRSAQTEGRPLTPKVALDGEGRSVFFAPIFTTGPCLVCHGQEGNMDPSLRDLLTALYPNDHAMGFSIDELRGIWSITFKNS